MTTDTCSTLITLIPVFLLAVVLEAGRVSIKMRLKPWYTTLIATSIVTGFFSMVLAAVGLIQGGYTAWNPTAVLIWAFSATNAACTLLFVLLLGISLEDEAKDEAEAEEEKAAEREKLEKLGSTPFGKFRLGLRKLRKSVS